MDLTGAMARYERARLRARAQPASTDAAREMAAARVALVDLLAADGWVPELRVSSQVERDMALLRREQRAAEAVPAPAAPASAASSYARSPELPSTAAGAPPHVVQVRR